MADNRNIDEQRKPNQTMQHENAKAQVSGQRQDEGDKLDRQRQEKSAIGGQQQQPSSRAGEPGMPRSEFDQTRNEAAGEKR